MAGIAPPMTIAVCSNRPTYLRDAVMNTARAARGGDRILVVFDGEASRLCGEWRGHVIDGKCRLVCNGMNMGLAYSRNRALKESEFRHLVFVDDDIVVGRDVLDSIRQAFVRGAAVVGSRITAEFGGQPVPWYLTSGQLHYLGSHSPSGTASIWGGCMGVDVEVARLLGVGFDETLGRSGGTLCSAEDTTFVRAMVAGGARSEILDEVAVQHVIASGRLQLAYLLRRSYWQGRSEARRRDPWYGIRKEWTRNAAGDGPPLRRFVLSALYTGSVGVGAMREVLGGWWRGTPRHGAARAAERQEARR